MKSEKYWKQLSEEREKYIQSGADETAKRMVRLYDKAASDINEQIKKMFDRFVKTSGLTDEEAERYISKTQSDAEIRKLKILLENTEGAAQKREIKNKITAAAYKSRMTRKEAVLNNIYVLTKNLANEEIERTKALYSKTVKESYYRTVFDVFKGVSAGADFTKLDEKAINKMINVKWYGKNFSERIWKNTDLLASAAQDVISSGIATGKTYMQMVKEIEGLGLGSAKASVRLVRTQVSYFRGQSELQAYREAGFEKYKFVASLKEKGTCDKCGGLDGKVFDIDDARAGKNYNPIHPNCRCTTIAYFGKSTGKRIAQSDGETYYVPSDMTYTEWKKNYVDNSNLIKNIEVLGGFNESNIISEDIKTEILNTIDAVMGKYNVKVDEFSFEYISEESGKVPFQFQPINNNGIFKSRFVINKGFNWEKDLDTLDERIYNRNYKRGVLAAQNTKGLILHEMAHFMSFQDCYTYDDFEERERILRNSFISGVSGYSDMLRDGAETIAEAFVRLNNGEKVDPKVIELVNKFVERWKK